MKQFGRNVVISILGAFLFGGCVDGKPSKVMTPSQVEPIEVIDGHAILPLPVDGFDHLATKDKLLAYYLYQSAIAGRDINFDQNHRHSLAIKNLCEEILLHSKGIDKKVIDDIAHYLKLQYANVGIHGKLTFAKFLPPDTLTFEILKDAAEKAVKNGAKFKLKKEVSLTKHLHTLKATIFDPNIDPFCTSRSPKPGEDLLSISANNYYEHDLRLAELDGFKEKYPLNSKVTRGYGRLIERVWRTGDPKRNIPSGLYARELTEVVKHLKEALKYASAENAESIRTLIDFYQTGDNETFRKYNIAWLKYNKPVVDTINGFIEEYRDPREKKAAWEGQVFFINENTSGWLRAVADKADYYETKAPFAEEYRRKGAKPIANMVEVLIETGDGGPISWSGVKLPNAQDISDQYGSKNILLWNARTAREQVAGEKKIREFVWPEDQESVLKHSLRGAEILVGFHEAVGHASGKKSDKMEKDPSEYLPGYYSWVEEERSDLLALHHAWDPETFRIRKDWTKEAARALYKKYVVDEMLNLAEVPEGETAMEEPHAVGGNFAIRYFMKKWKVVEEVKRKIGEKEKTFWIVRDENIPRMREAVAELLRELQRIKSEGDLEAIKKLDQEYGATVFDPNLAKELRERKKALQIPSYYVFVFPKLELITSKQGQDVRLIPQNDFLRQQMGWSGYSDKELKKLPSWL